MAVLQLDPKMAGKTYLVRNPKFKQLSRTPNVSVIVAKQRKERPLEVGQPLVVVTLRIFGENEEHFI